MSNSGEIVTNSINCESNNNNVICSDKSIEPKNVTSCFESVDQKPLVVHIKDLCFDYSKKEKLIDNLNVNIQQGHIYGLLGPSGCGKSTTLKIILGIIRPQKGEVQVFGTKPNTPNSSVPGPGAGYMPQDLSMIPTLTVGDHFSYYGILNGMKDREINKQSSYLQNLLNIPSLEKPVEQLSGGQQRRASLAVALLHSPSLLILDEPTVGIDPILRNRIWDYLIELTIKESKTIILTTHYIEEARNAHMIGLMRYGRLLAESNPERLLTRFQMSTIEDVFLNLCEKDDSLNLVMKSDDTNVQEKGSQKMSIEDSQHRPKPVLVKYNKKMTYSYSFEKTRCRAMTFNTYTFMMQKFWTTVLTCLLPTLQIYLFHYSIGKAPKSISISVSNLDNYTRGNKFSETWLSGFDSSVKVNRYSTAMESIESVKNGLSLASFEIKSNFTKCLINRVRKGYSASDYDIDCSQVRMVSDHTYQFIVFKLILDMKNAFTDAIYKFFPDLGYNPESINVPVKIEEYVFGNDEFSFQEFMTPGMYMALIYLAPMIVTLFLLLEMKTQGHIERSRACGAKVIEIITSHFFVNSTLLVIQMALMMITSLYYFEAPNRGSLWLLLGIVFLEGLSGTATAILMGSVIQEKITALVFIYALTISLWIICGVFWPIQNITLLFLQKLVLFLPLTLPIESARNIMNRAWEWNHLQVMFGFGSAFAYCAVPLILAYVLFR